MRTRARTCESWLPLWRALNANQGESTELKARIEQVRKAVWERLEIMYQPELAALDERRRRHTLIALEAITDFESWRRMREDSSLRVEEACAVWIMAVDRLLPGRPVS